MLELNLNDGSSIKISDDNKLVISDKLKQELENLIDENGNKIIINEN